MPRTIIISNRLPVQIRKKEDACEIQASIGGLATGLRSVHQAKDSLWLGWCGLADEELNEEQSLKIEKELLSKYKCAPVFLSKENIELYYNCFSNKTLWPLLHHFPMLTTYQAEYWEGYQKVNRMFFERLKKYIQPDDIIWVHDYQLLLLPQMIKSHFKRSRVGFFLHIPFPSYEIFRLLPWRSEVLEGMLGSDLIGFHTYDYARHFISSVRRILRMDATLGTISTGRREVAVDVFPMGIDYEKFYNASDLTAVKKRIRKFRQGLDPLKIMLSVDRLDYTKGIPNRLLAYDRFLEKYPKWKEKVALVLIVAPSRTDVDTYQDLKREVDELVSRINSKHSTIGWAPIAYFFRAFSFEGLAALYGMSDVLLVTPLRDGMNLIVKEYIATRKDKQGVVVLSETTGAASELGEAILVNPNNNEEIADAIDQAFLTSIEDQIKANTLMHQRLEHYNVDVWAKEFLRRLTTLSKDQETLQLYRMDEKQNKSLFNKYSKSKKRLLFLDYDGTLVGFKPRPEQAIPDPLLMKMLTQITEDHRNHLVIISGRDKDILEKWLGKLDAHLVSGHGIWLRECGKDWRTIEKISNAWKEEIRPVLDFHVSRTPRSFVEEKEFSLAWHYRNCDPDFGAMRAGELKDTLMGLTGNLNLGILDGNKVIEIKDTTINKGRAALYWMQKIQPDFILSIGDDWTDEDMFAVLPEDAFSIKVGPRSTKARFCVEDVYEVREILKKLSGIDMSTFNKS